MRFISMAQCASVMAGLATSAVLGVLPSAHASQPPSQAQPLSPEVGTVEAIDLSLARSAAFTSGELSAYSVDGQSAPSAMAISSAPVSFSATGSTLNTLAFADDSQATLALLSALAPSDHTKSLTVDTKTQLTPMDVASADVASAGLKQVDGIATDEIYGFSYVGGGLNIGLGRGSTGLGQTSFAIISKIGLTDYLSVRPSLLFTGNFTILLPVTYDFRGRQIAGSRVLPFLGAGLGIGTENFTNFELLVTGGVDVPLSREFTATASLNATITGRAAIGLLLGLGYNFE